MNGEDDRPDDEDAGGPDDLTLAVPGRLDEGDDAQRDAGRRADPRRPSGGVVAALALFVVLLAGLAVFLVRAGGPPPSPEERARQPLAPRPQAPPVGRAATGAPIYETYCARCHGAHGDDGTAPNLRAQRVALAPDEVIVRLVRGGRPGMPALDLAPDEEVPLLAYLRYLQGLPTE